MRELFPGIDEWRAAHKPIALATVVSVAGSAPRGVGAKMAVSGDGEMIGSVSGGCVENAVIETARDVLQTNRPRLVKFGVSDEDAWEVGLACGGTIEVFIEPLI
ncbi:MAG TPA: XdhC family protein [Chloroflexota bacterium]|nr:XdhC family protein [Chloroflexota bacterium]